jgi:hypothetical protein
MGKRSVSGAVIAAVVAGLFALGTIPAWAGPADDEAAFVRKTNEARHNHGLGSLSVQSDLVAVARRHSHEMANKGTIYHNDNLGNEVGGNWTVLGENVGMGPSVDSLQTAFMNSHDHRENILYRAFNQVGVGVVWDGDTLYVTVVFAARSSSSSSSGGSTSSGSGSSSPTYAAAASPVSHVSPPTPKPAQPKPNTVETLVAVLGLDADVLDPATGRALGL